MIHADVNPDKEQKGHTYRDHLVQTSVDGAAWTTQYRVTSDVGEYPDFANDEARKEAEKIARIFVCACRFCGQEVRATSGGYELC